MGIDLPLAILFLVVVVIAVGFILITLIDNAEPTGGNYEAFRNLMLGFAALIGGPIGFYLSWRRTDALDEQNKTARKQAETVTRQAKTLAKQANTAAKQAKTAAEQAKHAMQKHEDDKRLANKRHDAEAFGRGIEQLGETGKPSVQLGGIYAMEALAKSSPSMHGPIFETLCAHVRENCPIVANKDAKKPDEVVQTILTVIGRRKYKNDPEPLIINLDNTDLRKVDLSSGHFETVSFTHALLNDAQILWAHLEGAFFLGAQLEGATFLMSTIKGSWLRGANLNSADLSDVTFDEFTDVSGADLRNIRGLPEDFQKTVKSDEFTKWTE